MLLSDDRMKWRHELLGLPKTGDGTCRNGYGIDVLNHWGTKCAYCDRELGDPYESWLDVSVDHIIPGTTLKTWGQEYREWLGDISNMITCCRACNEFMNGYRVPTPDQPPADRGAFFELRDRVFVQKQEHVLKRHARERECYERWAADSLTNL